MNYISLHHISINWGNEYYYKQVDYTILDSKKLYA